MDFTLNVTLNDRTPPLNISSLGINILAVYRTILNVIKYQILNSSQSRLSISTVDPILLVWFTITVYISLVVTAVQVVVYSHI